MPKSSRKAKGRSKKLNKQTVASRPLRMEFLEERALLAGDLGLAPFAEGEGGEPLVAVHLQALDLETRQPLDAIYQGEEFLLVAAVEDLRPSPAGVFGAYLDLRYPSDVFATTGPSGQAVLVYGDRYGNGKAGVATPGMVDELGTFAAGGTKIGGGEHVLAGIRLVANRTGEVTFSSDAAEESPAHDILLFDRNDPVMTNLVMYGSLTMNVLEPLPEEIVDAISDAKSVDENSTDNLFVVLANDKNTTGEPLAISAVDLTDTAGDVSIADGGKLLIYTPARGFVGTDEFTYTVTANGVSDTANVRVDVKRVVANEDQVGFDFAVKDPDGIPVSNVTVGDEFVLHVTAEDLRTVPTGVFAAYMDIRYTSEAADLAGQIQYGAKYQNGLQGSTAKDGEIDEVGAFSGTNPLGAGRFEVFQIPFRATAPGKVVFEASPADEVPSSDTLLYYLDEVVGFDEIAYGRASIVVSPAVIAVDDSYHIDSSSTINSFAVLENDVNLGKGDMRVVSVDSTGVRGTIDVTEDGLAVTYVPQSGFGGSEQFTYTISGPGGLSTAQVTVHLNPIAAFDDQLEIRLETTDLAGNPIASVPAGQEFLVKTIVKDLRPQGTDRGVFGAYLDLLYEKDAVHTLTATNQPLGILAGFGPEYQNGRQGDASLPGLIDELGAFQTSTGSSLGSGEFLLSSVRFQATAAQGVEDSFEISEDQAISLDVLDNDVPVTGEATFRADPADKEPSSDVLFFDPVEPVGFNRVRYGEATIEITAGGEGGIVSVSRGNAGGSIVVSDNGASLLYTPAANFNGTENFTYSLGGGARVRVAVHVAPVNDAPVANGDSYRVQSGKSISVAADAGVTKNDLDVDGDAITAAILSNVAHGTLSLEADGSFTYQPEPGFVGADTFTYAVSDGSLESNETSVVIDVVPRPVSIHMEAIDANGAPLTDVTTDKPLIVRTTVQDLRSATESSLGIGAAYLDIVYDPGDVEPLQAPNRPLGLDVRFGQSYQNGLSGDLLTEGRLDNIGGLQSGFKALGGDAVELFTLAFDLGGPRTIDESYIVAHGADVSRLDVLANEIELEWQVTLDAQHAANSPASDVVYLNPVEVVPEADIQYRDVVVNVRNGNLSIQSLGAAESGATLSIDEEGRVVYEAPEGFSGFDSFTYVLVDRQGNTSTATATVEVVESWQNTAKPTDVNGDGHDSPADALIIINELNEVGPHALDGGVVAAFYDVSGDGEISPIDVLIVVNRLIAGTTSAEGEFTSGRATQHAGVVVELLTPPVFALNLQQVEVLTFEPQGTALPETVLPELVESVDLSSHLVAYQTDSPAVSGAIVEQAVVDELEDDEFEELLDTMAEDMVGRGDLSV